ncbi:replication-associated recombination protein A [Schleiferilactobacillus harbinensis]|jgi:putative ATPase|uniref:replication-associated recombination protein A n=1 Tax=Schleiferilactobacillus harbinensis TaxID=304207 RepID=UPI00242CB973|nr:replication-associated recombination protein A [Schleiferilactobacillus harbinensis]MCI1686971.1 replication-associated recombination protein A [Schleiferilactobacillus harbinensis]MCI1783356.1 replication-associated recombination protein A [Schleiferilactobacillus harbinensis]MCI1851960.1 replication-associated recombination protein A [Schleiferilactobacillus harbinensis]
MVEPLAYRMRPTNLDEVVGQQDLVGPGKIIRRMVQAKRLSSMILYGPPGIGKTSIASAIAGSTKYHLRILNAATDTKKDLQVVAEEGRMSGTVILLLDEIHRLDKTKQDFLLPHLESGRIILIGATTENPYINISPAIRSRTQIFALHPLAVDDIEQALHRALSDKEKGLGGYPVTISDDTLRVLAQGAHGDLRTALNTLELAVLSTPTDKQDDRIHVTEQVIVDSGARPPIAGDKNGDAHYDTISAFQKSIRGSDTDAALHYLAVLTASGDLPSIMRRLLVIAYEDVGMANLPAAARTVAAVQAAERLGLPEGRIPLADAVIELCLSPKSNSGISAVDAALADVNSGKGQKIPAALKDAHYKGAKELGHGTTYKYPHAYPGDWVAQQYLPDDIKTAQYYEPKHNGKYETAFAEQYARLRQAGPHSHA